MGKSSPSGFLVEFTNGSRGAGRWSYRRRPGAIPSRPGANRRHTNFRRSVRHFGSNTAHSWPFQQLSSHTTATGAGKYERSTHWSFRLLPGEISRNTVANRPTANPRKSVTTPIFWRANKSNAYISKTCAAQHVRLDADIRATLVANPVLCTPINEIQLDCRPLAPSPGQLTL